MKKNTIIIVSLMIIVFILIGFSGSIFSQSEESKELFEEIRKAYKKELPKDFIANVESEHMDKDLEEVPDYEKINPDDSFSIKFVFIKQFGERIIVENACMLTRNKFQNYLEVYKTFRSFLDPSIKSESFFRKYNWMISNKNPELYEIKMIIRGIKNEYYKIYINKKNKLVKSASYFKNEEEIGRVDITYDTVDTFTVPTLIEGYTNVIDTENKLKKQNFKIMLNNFKVNLGLTIDDILGDDEIDC